MASMLTYWLKVDGDAAVCLSPWVEIQGAGVEKLAAEHNRYFAEAMRAEGFTLEDVKLNAMSAPHKYWAIAAETPDAVFTVELEI